jgi:CRP-like cAMP-binding protein
MYDRLQQHLSSYITLTPDEWTHCQSLFVPKQVRKKQYLLQLGEVSKYLTFVESGTLRSYTVDEKGAEHIVQFALEGWWISDMYSYLTREPSTYCIEALADSEVLLLDRPSEEKLLQDLPKFERYFRLLLQNNYVATHRRLMSNMSASAEENYKALIAKYPQLIQRVPQHMIASYLGITPAFLSRLRNRMAHEK